MKQLTKLFALLLVFAMLLPVFPANAAEPAANQYETFANFLNSLGLFQGTQNGYELERAPSRAEAAAMLVRLLGKDEAAKACTASHPFTDVPTWADRYVAYLYSEGLTQGTSATTFGSDTTCNGQMYLTFVLRALGYDDSKGDFSYSNAVLFARMEDVITSDYALMVDTTPFTRGEVTLISYWALFSVVKDTDDWLLETLLADGAVPAEVANGYLDIRYAIMETDYAEYMSYSVGGWDKTETQQISYSISGYPPMGLELVTEFQLTDLFTNPKASITENLYSPNGVNTYQSYISDGYRYVETPDGEKYREPLDDGDEDITAPADDEEVFHYMLFDDYQSSSATYDKDGNSIVLHEHSEKAGKEAAIAFLNWFEDADFAELTEKDYIVIVKSYVTGATITADGFYINELETLEFDYMLLSDGQKISVSVDTITEYTNPGEVPEIKLPALTGYTDK